MLRPRLRLFPIVGATLLVWLAVSGQLASRVSAVAGNLVAYPVGNYPLQMAVDEQLNRVYVASYDRSWSVVDLQNNTVQTIPTDITLGIAFNPVTGKIYTVHAGNRLRVWHRDNPSVELTSLPTPDYPNWIAVNPLTNKVYIPAKNEQVVAVIDGNTDTMIGRIDLKDRQPVGAAVDQDRNQIYITAWQSPFVAVIDGQSDTVIRQLDVGGDSVAAAVDPSTGIVYTTSNPGSGWVNAFDSSGSKLGDINVSTRVTGIAFNSATNKIFVLNDDDRECANRCQTISVLQGDPSQSDYLQEIELIWTPTLLGWNAAVDPVRSRIFYADSYASAGNNFYVIQDDPPSTLIPGDSAEEGQE